MDQLWAPWRLSYVAAPKEKLCDDRRRLLYLSRHFGTLEADDRANLLVHRSKHSVVVLNRFPYNNGHLLVCPKSHKASLEELTNDELLDLQLVTRELVAILRKRLREGFNIGLNLGRARVRACRDISTGTSFRAGSAIPTLMPIVGDTKVISQSLESLYDLLKEEPG